MYQRGMDGIGTQGLSGLFDSIINVAQGVTQGAQAAQQIASGSYTPYPGSAPVLYAAPSYAPPAPASSGSGSGVSTTLLLGSAAVLVGVLFLMRRGRR